MVGMRTCPPSSPQHSHFSRISFSTSNHVRIREFSLGRTHCGKLGCPCQRQEGRINWNKLARWRKQVQWWARQRCQECGGIYHSNHQNQQNYQDQQDQQNFKKFLQGPRQQKDDIRAQHKPSKRLLFQCLQSLSSVSSCMARTQTQYTSLE